VWVAALILVAAVAHSRSRYSDDVTVHAFVRPDGPRLHLLIRVPLKAMRDVGLSARGAGLLDLALADAALRNAATAVDRRQRRALRERRPPRLAAASMPVSLSPTSPSHPTEQALAHVTGPRLPTLCSCTGNRDCSTSCSSIDRAGPLRLLDPAPAQRLGLRTTVVLRFLPPRRRSRLRLHGDPGLVRLDPRWHQAACASSSRDSSTSSRDRSSAVPPLPGDPVPEVRAARPAGHLVYSRALDHAYCFAYNFGPDALWFPRSSKR